MIVYREAPTLARDLGIPLHTLYAVSSRISSHYHRVDLPKKSGGVRRLAVPDEPLKAIQRRIVRTLLAGQPISPYATAYRYGVGVVQNAAVHAGRARVLKLDICRFFDHIRYTQVKDAAFPPEIFAEPLRVLLAMLCYYKEGLPQGAPSSPAIANLVMRDFDEQVGTWCRTRGVRYTRYCDDLTFSSDGSLDGVEDYVAARLRELGFALQPGKTRLCARGQRQLVTGLVVNERPALPAERRRKLRQELYYCKKFGVEDHLRRMGLTGSGTEYLQRLLGRVSFWLQADPASREAAEYRAWLRAELRARRDQDNT